MSGPDEKTRILAGKPFRCPVSGPDVAVSTLYPVVEHGPGWLRVKALAVSLEAQEEIVDAMGENNFRQTLINLVTKRLDSALDAARQAIRSEIYDDEDTPVRLTFMEVERAAQRAITSVLNDLDRVGIVQALQAFPETLDLHAHANASLSSFEGALRAMLVLAMTRAIAEQIHGRVVEEFADFGDFDAVVGVASDAKGWIEEFEQFDEIEPSSKALQALIDNATHNPDALLSGLRECRDELSSRQGFAAARDIEQAIAAVGVLALAPVAPGRTL